MGKETSTEPALPSRIYGINQQKPPSLLSKRIKNSIAAGACAIAAAGTVYGAIELEPYLIEQDAVSQQNILCSQTKIAPTSCGDIHMQNVIGEWAERPLSALLVGGACFAAYQFGSRAIRP